MDIRDRRPEEMEAYLSNFGWHFNKKMCEFAVSLMKKLNPSTGKKERIEPISKEKVDESDSAYLGIVGVDVTDDVAKTYNMPSGVYVAQVTGGSAAEQAGIQKGDIITEFDGKLIGSMEELSSTMEYYKAGTTVDVKIERSTNGEYQEQTISVTLGKKN